MNEKYLDAIVDIDNLNRKTTFRRYQPSDQLEDIIELYWSVSWHLEEGEIIEQKILPNPHINIVHYSDGTYVEGVVKSCFSYRLEGTGEILGIKFKIGGFNSIHSMNASKLTNEKIPINQLLNDRWHELDKFSTLQDKINWIEKQLMTHGRLHKNAFLADEIINKIKSDGEIINVDQICELFDIRMRSLQRLFSEFVGVNPKWVIRMFRLQELKVRVEENQLIDWSSLAYDLGYNDQAHMINDFKSIVGTTPKKYKEERNK